MDCFIARTYRRDPKHQPAVRGLVERRAGGGRVALSSSEQLRAFITAAPGSRRIQTMSINDRWREE
jgi:hypothetical protein